MPGVEAAGASERRAIVDNKRRAALAFSS